MKRTVHWDKIHKRVVITEEREIPEDIDALRRERAQIEHELLHVEAQQRDNAERQHALAEHKGVLDKIISTLEDGGK